MQADVERFLARLFVDQSLRERFLLDPAIVAAQNGLSTDECRDIETISPPSLLAAARSYEHKRRHKAHRRK